MSNPEKDSVFQGGLVLFFFLVLGWLANQYWDNLGPIQHFLIWVFCALFVIAVLVTVIEHYLNKP